MIKHLRECNPMLRFYDVREPEFLPFGNVLDGYDLSPFLEVLAGKGIPASGNIYQGCDPVMMKLLLVRQLSDHFYGGMPIEAGFCNGKSSKLNAFEYHRGSEIDIAGSDLVLLLDQITSIVDNEMCTDQVRAFFVPKGTAVQLYETTLHFAPCRVKEEGFRCGVVLPMHTNEELERPAEMISREDSLLWMRNKWLIAHSESIPASKGAHIGIRGKNIEVFF